MDDRIKLYIAKLKQAGNGKNLSPNQGWKRSNSLMCSGTIIAKIQKTQVPKSARKGCNLEARKNFSLTGNIKNGVPLISKMKVFEESKVAEWRITQMGNFSGGKFSKKITLLKKAKVVPWKNSK